MRLSLNEAALIFAVVASKFLDIMTSVFIQKKRMTLFVHCTVNRTITK